MSRSRTILINAATITFIAFALESGSSLLLYLKGKDYMALVKIAGLVKGKLITQCPNNETVSIRSSSKPIDHPVLGRFGHPYASITYEVKNNTKHAGIYIWSETSGKYGNRVSSADQTDSPRTSSHNLLVLGDSFMRGHAVNDSGSFTWLLQSQIPKLNVWNFARGGAGLVHQSILLRDALQENRIIPRSISDSLKNGIILIGYGDYYDERNTYNPEAKKNLDLYKLCNKALINGRKFYRPTWSETDPAARLTAEESFEILKISQLTSSSSIESLQEMSTDSYRTKLSIAIIQDILQKVDKLGATPVIAYLRGSDDNKVLNFIKGSGVDILDFRGSKGLHDIDTLEPFDYHPGYLSHQGWSLKVRNYIQKIYPEIQ